MGISRAIGNVLGKSVEEYYVEEIGRLKLKIAEKDAFIQRLSSNLAISRAYPLLATLKDTDETEHNESEAKKNSDGNSILKKNDKRELRNLSTKDFFAELDDFLYYVDENGLKHLNFAYEDDTPDFIREEEKVQDDRLLSINEIYRQYVNEKQERKKKVPHITNIRNLKSFTM